MVLTLMTLSLTLEWSSYWPLIVDMSCGMRAIRHYPHFANRCFGVKSPIKEDLTTILCRQIRSAGPISVAEYMKIAMHHPVYVCELFCQTLWNFIGILQQFFCSGTWRWFHHFTWNKSDFWWGKVYVSFMHARSSAFGSLMSGWITGKTHLLILWS